MYIPLLSKYYTLNRYQNSKGRCITFPRFPPSPQMKFWYTYMLYSGKFLNFRILSRLPKIYIITSMLMQLFPMSMNKLYRWWTYGPYLELSNNISALIDKYIGKNRDSSWQLTPCACVHAGKSKHTGQTQPCENEISDYFYPIDHFNLTFQKFPTLQHKVFMYRML